MMGGTNVFKNLGIFKYLKWSAARNAGIAVAVVSAQTQSGSSKSVPTKSL
jgi:hypothetical protein